jgi:hypothetical protein
MESTQRFGPNLCVISMAMFNESCLCGKVIPKALREEVQLDFASVVFSQCPEAARRWLRHGTSVTHEAAVRDGVRLASRKTKTAELARLPSRAMRRLSRR